MSSSVLDTDSHIDDTYCGACGGRGGFLCSAPVWKFDEAARQGCVTCGLVKSVLWNYAAEINEHEIVSIVRGAGIEEILVKGNQGCPLHVSLYGHDAPVWNWAEYSRERNLQPSMASELPNIGGDTSSSDSISLIKKWISQCHKTHDGCRQGATSRLPNRVLDLGDSTDTSIRLLQTQNEEAEYICLSHCWGRSELFQTRRETLHQRNRGIEWTDLPKTFQDAVKVTRSLGIQYLWIDSLCIIQNDDNDWRQESAQMHIIYRDSYLTIAASKSNGPNGGLFAVSSPNYMLREWRVDSQTVCIRTRRKIHHFESSNQFPLLDRGWVFQERVLSRRILHFGPQELIWECMEEQACECSLIASASSDEIGLGKKRLYRPVKVLGSDVWLMLVWWKTVQDYSALDLTYEKDIFPALSGVTQQHMAVRKSKYLAGLWENTFVHDLLWYVPNRTNLPGIPESRYNHGLRPLKWRAPTWSWASIRSAVKYDHYTAFNEAIKIEKVNVEAVDGNTAGELVAASLVVSGEMAAVNIRRNCRIQLSSEDFESVGTKERLPASFSKDYDIWAKSDDQIDEGEEVYFLLAAKVFDNQTTGMRRDEVWFMVLRLVDRNTGSGNSDNCVYARIGLAKMEVTDEPLPDFLATFVHEDNVIII